MLFAAAIVFGFSTASLLLNINRIRVKMKGMENYRMDLDKVIAGYFAAIRAKDIEGLMALYASDASFSLPDGRQFSGTDAIRAMHLSVFAASAPQPSPGRTIIAPSAAAVEIEARLPDGSVRHTTNHFFLNKDGKIERLSVYVKTG